MKRACGPYVVDTSNEDKNLYPGSGISKGDIIDHYEGVYAVMQSHLRDRCLTVKPRSTSRCRSARSAVTPAPLRSQSQDNILSGSQWNNEKKPARIACTSISAETLRPDVRIALRDACPAGRARGDAARPGRARPRRSVATTVRTFEFAKATRAKNDPFDGFAKHHRRPK